jgi:hypothetical protein
MAEMRKRIGELQSLGDGKGSAEEVEIAEAYRKIAREYKKLGIKEDDRSDGSR